VLNILVVVLLCISQEFLLAQDYVSGYLVVPTEALGESEQSMLGNKIKVALSKAGIVATDGYFPMVTMVEYDEVETIKIQGIRTMFKTYGTVTVLITFANTGAALASEEFNVEGVGTTEALSKKSAISNIAIDGGKLKAMTKSALVNYKSLLDTYCDRRISEAKKLRAQGDLESAIEAASEVPNNSVHYASATTLLADLNRQVEQRRTKEEKQREKEESRAHQLELEKIKAQSAVAIEKEKSERQAAADRSRTTQRYYEMWRAYFNSR
jgi:hypothetical protein